MLAGQRLRSTQPGSSSRATACESRLCKVDVIRARAFMCIVRPGASDSLDKIAYCV
jgi:hypothetical protein